MRRRVGIVTSVLAGLILPIHPSVSQVADAAPVKAGEIRSDLVPQAEIPARADADDRFAQDVIQRAERRGPKDQLEPRLDALAASVQELAALLESNDLALLPAISLDSLGRHWRFYERQLETWRRDLESTSGRFPEDAAELARRRVVWDATRIAAEGGSIAPALADRIRTVQAQLGRAEQAVSGPIERQIRLGRRANSVESAISTGQKAVAAAIAHIDSRLWKIDSPPVWELWREPGRTSAAARSVMTGLALETRFLEEYASATSSKRHLKNALALALLPLVVWLSWRSRKVVTEDPEIQAAARVLHRPISAWLVLVLVGTLLLEPDAPTLMYQAVLLAALIPVLRLLPREVFAVLGPWPYVATGLYLLDNLRFLFLDDALHFRLHLLAVTLLTLGTLVWLLLRARRRIPVSERRVAHKVIHVTGCLAAALLGVSVTAAVMGNVSLAEMLTEALLESGYVGLMLYAGVTVLVSVLRMLLARRAMSRFRVITQHAGPLLRSLTRLLRLAAAVTWIVVTLNEFRVFRPIYGAVRSILVHPLSFGNISLTLGNVLLFAFAVYLAFWVAKTVRYVLRDEVLPKMSLPRGVGNSVSSLTYYALVFVGLMVALAAAGFEMSQFAIIVGALGVGIGFGLQNVVNNFVSGLILMFERPIQPGDVVEITGTSGKVREIGMRATTLKTFEGADVVVPNGTLLSEKLINWTLIDMDRRVDVNLGVAYGSNPRQVMALLMEVTKSTPGVAVEPAPAVVFVGFGPSTLDFGIRAWTHQFGDWVDIRSELSVRVYEALDAAGIEIPFPQQVVHLRPQAGRSRPAGAATHEVAAPAQAPGTPG